MSDDDQKFGELANIMTKALADEGKLIEAGFTVFAAKVMHKDAPPEQRQEMQLAFMAGAQHVFAAVMNILDGDESEEAIELELNRLDKIHEELELWRETVLSRFKVKS
jgi:hypothetical protein